MDGYLSKPIDTRALVDTLLLHISKRQRRSNESVLALAATSATSATPVQPVTPETPATPAAPAAPTTASTAAEPPRFLNPAKAIELLGGDRELYFSLVPPFCERLRVVDAQLQPSAEPQTADDQLRLLHTLRGMASTMGAEGLAAQAKTAERIGHETDQALDAATLAGVRQAISRTLAELSSLAEKPSP
jgi:HPt (histidine-containing phosphotransfer) domain-containing protein